MKKIIKIALLSTVGLSNLAWGANPLEPNEDGVVLGSVISGVAEGAVMEVGDQQRAQGLRMIDDMKAGILPNEILDLFAGLRKIDVAKRDSLEAMQAMFRNLQTELKARLDDEGIRYLNVVLRSSVSSPGHLYLSAVPPLAQKFFGEMPEAITAETFFAQLTYAYHALFVDPNRVISADIKIPIDWATVQFLGLFFDNAINTLRFNIHASELGNAELVILIVTALQHEATLTILNISDFHREFQVQILKGIAELRPKNADILNSVTNVTDLEDFVLSMTDSSLQTISEGDKVDNIIILDFKHRELSERGTALVTMVGSFADRSVPHVWDLILKLKNLENIPAESLTSVIRSIVRSPLGVNLSLSTLTSYSCLSESMVEEIKKAFPELK